MWETHENLAWLACPLQRGASSRSIDTEAYVVARCLTVGVREVFVHVCGDMENPSSILGSW